MASAGEALMGVILACACVLRRMAAWSMYGSLRSSTNVALPVRNRTSSRRLIGAPIYGWAMVFSSARDHCCKHIIVSSSHINTQKICVAYFLLSRYCEPTKELLYTAVLSGL